MNVTRVCEHTFLDDGLRDASVVLDLGCNHGEFAHTVIDRYGCRVYAAEPVVALCQRIRPSDRLRLERVALGGRTGSETVNIFAGRCASILGPRGTEDPSASQDTEVITLDAFFDRFGLKSVDLMKVDIEGAEVPMFEAATAERLKQIRQITVEFHDFLYPKLRPKVEAVKRRLESLGFLCLSGCFSRPLPVV